MVTRFWCNKSHEFGHLSEQKKKKLKSEVTVINEKLTNE
jgi:hypothetical protein